jgi:hypothetical protein
MRSTSEEAQIPNKDITVPGKISSENLSKSEVLSTSKIEADSLFKILALSSIITYLNKNSSPLNTAPEVPLTLRLFHEEKTLESEV